MASVDFGQIPFNLICRFGEITKTEIIILSYLYACRNEQTKQCNPSRKTMSADTGIHKSHLSPAVKSLEENEWILEDENGNYTLFGNPKQKVTESVTTKQKVTKSVTKVTDSVTKSYEIGNSHNKEFEHRKNIERTENKKRLSDKSDPPKKPRLVSELSKSQKQEFNTGMKFLQEKISKYPDGAAQGKALKWMLLNGANIYQIQKGLEREIAEAGSRYRVSFTTLQKNIFKWIQEGNGEIKLNGASNGSNQNNQRNGYPAKRTDADIFQESADFYADWEARESGSVTN